jgi:hypothetical protein
LRKRYENEETDILKERKNTGDRHEKSRRERNITDIYIFTLFVGGLNEIVSCRDSSNEIIGTHLSIILFTVLGPSNRALA